MVATVLHGVDQSGPKLPVVGHHGAVFVRDGNGSRYRWSDITGKWELEILRYIFQGSALQVAGKYVTDIVVPSGTVIWTGYIDTVVDFTADATISWGVATANDLRVAVDPSVGLQAIVPVGTAATAVKIATAGFLEYTIAVATAAVGNQVFNALCLPSRV
jgi:hypothetical protein